MIRKIILISLFTIYELLIPFIYVKGSMEQKYIAVNAFQQFDAQVDHDFSHSTMEDHSIQRKQK